MTPIRRPAALLVTALALALSFVAVRAQETASANGVKTWIGRAAEMEAYLKSAAVERMEGTAVGVTKPRHAFLKPGGPFGEMAWKVLPPGMYNGYYESYKTEIAAYEIDKLLELNMVPPTVERTIDKQTGAAVMWINGTKNFKELGGVPTPPARFMGLWNRELVSAKMFDDFIGNSDPNLGNWLVDVDWNIVLIDHSRAFGTSKDLTHELSRIHKGLWERMLALTEEQVAASPAGPFLEKKEVRAIFERRALMQKAVDKLVKSKGAAAYVP
ncbi:MAG TPA: hypothetical protein VGY57_06975 [Vicinamibacterales bacterium]|nr:hypothetical protein [Vicinamibacterales bacterium]